MKKTRKLLLTLVSFLLIGSFTLTSCEIHIYMSDSSDGDTTDSENNDDKNLDQEDEEGEDLEDRGEDEEDEGESSEPTPEPEPVHEHTFSEEWSYDSSRHWHEATCEHTEFVSNNKPHEFEVVSSIDATCTEEEYTTYRCVVCGYEYTATTAEPLGHTWDGGVVEIEPTCTKEGLLLHTCTICEISEEEVIPALGHDYIEDIEIEATCGAAGKETITCSRCDYYVETIIPATNAHNYDTGHITTDPTCTGKGVIEFDCLNCGYRLQLSVAATGHTYNEIDYDSDHHWVCCSVCGEKEEGTEAAHEYNYDEIYSDFDSHYYPCLYCDYHGGNEPHTYVDDEYCSECGHEFPFIYEINELSDSVTVTGLKEDGVNVTIPETIKGYTVTELSNGINPLTGFSATESITISSSVEKIGIMALSNHEGDFASLTSFTITDVSNSKLKEIGAGAFQATNITSFTFPEKLEVIGSAAFNGTSVSQVMVPDKVTSLGAYTFASNQNLTLAYIGDSLNSKITEIGPVTFYYCQNLKDVIIHSPLTTLTYWTFFMCSSLKRVDLPSTLTEIQSRAFYGCSSLEELVLPAGVTSIGDYAFYNAGIKTIYTELTDPCEVSSIDIGSCNTPLENAEWYFYSENTPTDSNHTYWHYVNGTYGTYTPTLWS